MTGAIRPAPCYPVGPQVRIIHRSVGRAFMSAAGATWVARRPGGWLARADWSPGGPIVVQFWSRPDIEPGHLRRLLARFRARPMTLVRVSASRLEWPGRWPEDAPPAGAPVRPC